MVPRENPAKRIAIPKVTKEMVEKDPDLKPEMICDVEIWADSVPAHVRRFDCLGCPTGGTHLHMRAGQMRDHLVVLHVNRGDTIPPHVINWAQRQANMAKQQLAILKAEREGANA